MFVGCDFPLEISINDGIAGYCFKTQEIVNLANARKDPRFDSAIDSITGFQTNSLLCMPIKDVQTGSSIGVVQVSGILVFSFPIAIQIHH